MDLKIGHKIKQRRKEMGFTLKQLAGDRITPAQISAIENNKCNPSTSLLEYLCKRLEVNIEYFTLTEEEKLKQQFDEIKAKCQELINNSNSKQASIEIENAITLFKSLDNEQKGFYYYVKGLAFYEAEVFMEAFDYFVKGMACYIKTKNNNMIADIYTKTGNSLFYMDKHDMALGYYKNAYNLIGKNIDNDIAAKIMFNMAICYSELERYSLCKETIDECIEFMKKNKCAKEEQYYAGLDMLKGIILKDAKDNDICLQNFKEAYEKYKSENDLIGMGRALYNLGMTSWEAGYHQDAVNYLNEAIEVKSKIGEKNIIDAYVSLSKLYSELKQHDKANEIISIAEEKMIQDDSKIGIIEVFLAKFDMYSDLGDYDKAEVFAYFALDHIQKHGMHKQESSLYLKLSEMYKKIGDEKSAIDSLLKANSVTLKGDFEKLHNKRT